MDRAPLKPKQPPEREMPAAELTLKRSRGICGTAEEKLAVASRVLQSLERQPVEPSLVFSRGKGSPFEVVPLGKGITVGRGADCTVSLPECTDLSRRHFGVRQEQDVWLVEDLGSRNGTQVDGFDARGSRRVVRDGDFI